MPKCEVDAVLLDEVRRFVTERGLTVNGAATVLGVDRASFWRFHNTGKARGDTRAKYRKALQNCNASSVDCVAVDEPDGNETGSLARQTRRGVLTRSELRQLRSVCEGILVLVSTHEAQQKSLKTD